ELASGHGLHELTLLGDALGNAPAAVVLLLPVGTARMGEQHLEAVAGTPEQQDPAGLRAVAHGDPGALWRYRRCRAPFPTGEPSRGTTLIEPSCSRTARRTWSTDSMPYSRSAAPRSSISRPSRAIAGSIH